MRKRKENIKQTRVLIFSLLGCLICMGIGYSVLTTSLNFQAKANKMVPKLADTLLADHSAKFSLVESVHYNQGNDIYIMFNNQKWQVLSVHPSHQAVKISGGVGDAQPFCGTNISYPCSGYYTSSTIYQSMLSYASSLPSEWQNKLTEGPFYYGSVAINDGVTQSRLLSWVKKEVVYAKSGMAGMEEYVMRIKMPNSNPKLSDYQDALNRLGGYYYNIWFMNSNGTTPLIWKANSGVLDYRVISDLYDTTYRPIHVLYLKSSLQIESGSGTFDEPYILR